MGFFDKVASLFSSSRLDVTQRFDLLREAVTGTMSNFYMARERKTGRLFGLKILDLEKTSAFEQRLKGLAKPPEGQIALALKHERLVTTYEVGQTTNNEQYVLMEFLEGPSLSSLIFARSDKLPGKRINLIRQMAEAVDAVHAAGYVHRDICPRNFICTPDLSALKLIDFGLTLPDTPAFRQPGNRTGTPAYMAPEVVRRRSTDKRLDVFSFGVSAFQLLTFELPWPQTENPAMAALAHDSHPPEDILFHRPKLNRALAGAIMKCLAKSPLDRPGDMGHFLRLIRQVQEEE